MELFGTAGIRGSAVEDVDPELGVAVGRAAARAADGGGDSAGRGGGAGGHAADAAFALGWDGRTSSPALAAAVAAGLASGGVDVERVGRVPTPALAFAATDRRGAMITASHNPSPDNGVKLFVDGVEYDAEADAAVEAGVEAGGGGAGAAAGRAAAGDDTGGMATGDDTGGTATGDDAGGMAAGDGDEASGSRGTVAGPDPVSWDRWGEIRDGDVLESYRTAVVAYVEARFPDAVAALDGRRVAVDCGNGVAGLATPQVLRSLGARPVALNANVDGHFPARESKPTPESLAGLREFVAGDDDVALGIGHDGDGDRLAVVGPDGGMVHEDTVVAVVAERYVRASGADDPVVVTTPNASGRIDDRVAAAGGRTERVALGALHEGIARERAAGTGDTEVVFAAEPWKHVHPAFGGWIDGIVSAAVVAALAAEAGGAGPLTADVRERPYRKESVPCPDAAKPAVVERVGGALPRTLDAAAVDTEYGVRVDVAGGGWVLVRPSGTEPYVRIYAEDAAVDDLVARVRGVVEDAVAAV